MKIREILCEGLKFYKKSSLAISDYAYFNLEYYIQK